MDLPIIRRCRTGVTPMSSDVFVNILTEHGPWVLLVFYLLYRDLQKDQATRDVVNKNSVVLTELTTLIRERLPRG